MSVADTEIIKEFLVESYENLDLLDREFVALEREPAARDRIAAVFRTIHTIKGTAGFLGLPRLEALAHAGESVLSLLRDGERNVGELAQACGYTSANISRHLAVLSKHGLVAREARGTSVYYRFADASVYALCDLVCGSIARQFERLSQDRQVFFPAPGKVDNRSG